MTFSSCERVHTCPVALCSALYFITLLVVAAVYFTQDVLFIIMQIFLLVHVCPKVEDP